MFSLRDSQITYITYILYVICGSTQNVENKVAFKAILSTTYQQQTRIFLTKLTFFSGNLYKFPTRRDHQLNDTSALGAEVKSSDPHSPIKACNKHNTNSLDCV